MGIGKITGNVIKTTGKGVKTVANAAGGKDVPILQSAFGKIAKIDWGNLPLTKQLIIKTMQNECTKSVEKIHNKSIQITETKRIFQESLINLNAVYISLRDVSMSVSFLTTPVYTINKDVEDMFEPNTLILKKYLKIKTAPTRVVEQEYMKLINNSKLIESKLLKLANEKKALDKQHEVIVQKIRAKTD